MWWDPWNNFVNGPHGPYIPFFIGRIGDDNVKEGNEFYQVYVNDEYIGEKQSVAQGDGGPFAVRDYLQSRGFNDFSLLLEGNQVRINTDGSEQSGEIKKHLSVYLSIR